MSWEPLSKAERTLSAAATGLVIAYQLWLSYAVYRHRRAVPRLADVAPPPNRLKTWLTHTCTLAQK